MNNTFLDTLQITGIRAYGYSGYFPEEQRLGQWFEAEVIFQLNLAEVGDTDALTDTLDYGEVVQVVQDLIQTSRCKTLERLATLVTIALLKLDPVHQVTLRLTKCQPPIPNFAGQVTIELTRSRQPDKG